MAGGQLFGFFGVLLALPVAAVVTVLIRHFYEWYGDKSVPVGTEQASDSDAVVVAAVLNELNAEEEPVSSEEVLAQDGLPSKHSSSDVAADDFSGDSPDSAGKGDKKDA